MRILLVKPPIRACMVEIGRHMPIGLTYLASAVRDAGHQVSVFDSLAFTQDNHIVAREDYSAADTTKIERHPCWSHLVHWGASWPRIEAAVADSQADVVGISCMFTPYYEPAYETARLVRRVLPRARVLLGGQHPTVAHPHALAESAFDVLVLGEAEASVTRIVSALETGQGLLDVPGVAFRCGAGLCQCADGTSRVHMTGREPWITDLDRLPRPAVDLLDMSAYDDTATLITSRGCPFSCSFCTVHATVGKSFRARSPRDVVDEIEDYVDRYSIRSFNIEDDNFTFDIARVHEICAEIRSRGLDVDLRLPNGMTVVKLTEDLVESMVGAGFSSLFLGLETTDIARLRRMRKGFTSIGKVADGAGLFSSHGIDVGASLIVGLPGQEIEDVARDSLNMASTGVRFWTNPFYPIPGSTDFVTCEQAGLISADTELALFDQFNFAIGSDRLSPAELYWSWVATQAIAQWPQFVLEGSDVRAVGESIDVGQAGSRLIAASAPLVGTSLEVPALPVALDRTAITAHPDGCFCAMQRVTDAEIPPDLCRFTGDVLALAIGLYSGRPMAARPSGRTPRGCTFVLHEEPDEVSAMVQQTFVRLFAEAALRVNSVEEKP